MEIPQEWAGEDFCYVTTTGRRTGTEHRIEIWFALDDAKFYLLAEGRERADWIRNMRADPNVTVMVAGTSFPAVARFVDDPDESARARKLLAAKYQDWSEGAEMSGWATGALLVALEPST